MEKSVDHYMSLPYTVELKPEGKGYRASVKELPGCKATAKASEGVEELWGRLKEDQRRRIEELLEFGDEVPEPAGTGADPFWASFPDGLDAEEAETMLYRGGATLFPLRILVELWLRELHGIGLAEVTTPGMAPKGGINSLDQMVHAREGDLRPVRLGKGLKSAWVKFDGPRAGHGHREIEILDQPLRTETAVVAALTTLEASIIEGSDFEEIREALLKRVEAYPELEGKSLQEVLDRLPARWFSERKDAADKKLNRRLAEQLSTLTSDEREKERKKRLPKRWRRWERHPRAWRRTIEYMVALLRHRRPDLEEHTFEQQLEFLDRHRGVVGAFLKEQRVPWRS